MEIAGQAALISGGGSGLGRATAQALAKAGARVAVLDINEAAAVAAAKEIGGFAAACDVTNAADTEAAVAAARERHGPARLVVACAGIGTAGRIVGRDGPLPLDEFRRTIEVNLIGSFNLLRLAAADMTGLDPLGDGERGLIVLTASVAAYEGQIGQAAYKRLEGRHRRADPAGRPRDGALWRAGRGDRTRHFRDPDARRVAAKCAGQPRRQRAVPAAPRPPRGVRAACPSNY